MKPGKIVLSRVYIFFFLLFAFATFIGFQIVNIQFFATEKILNQVKTTSAGYRPVLAERGDIYASDGSLLATSLHYYLVGMDLTSRALTPENFIEFIPPLCDSLETLGLGKTSEEYRSELIQARKDSSGWYRISKNLTYPEFKRLRKFPLFKLGRYKSGLVYKKFIKREKPFGVLAARTIGNRAPIGLEGAFNHYLEGTAGEQYQRRIPGGIWVPVNDRNSLDPEDGYDVYSTIDIGIQEIANNALKEQLLHHRADHGCVVVMETKTGKVRAISNLKVDTLGNAWEAQNYAIGHGVEPGSTFKLASMMALLEDDQVTLKDKVNVKRGVTKFYDRTMRDSHYYKEDRVMSVKEIFEESSNVGIAKLVVKAYKDEPDKFIKRLFSFKLNDKLGVDIHGEAKPKIKDPSQKDQWSGLTLPWMSIGYEVSLSALQVLAFYNAVANDGKLLKPIFVEKVCAGETVEHPYSTEVIKNSICSKETSKTLRFLLESVVTDGTAKGGFKGAPYTVAGKTGTAQRRYWERKKGEKQEYGASFVGYFPVDNPTYSCIVVISNPKRNGFYGSQAALPVFRKISDRLYSTSPSLRRAVVSEKVQENMRVKSGSKSDLKVIGEYLTLPTNTKNVDGYWAKSTYSNKLITAKNLKVKTKGVPNVKSLSMKDALFILENAGLRVVVKGSGRVVKQSLSPGEKVIKGKTIELILA